MNSAAPANAFDLPYQSTSDCIIPAAPAQDPVPLSMNRWGFADTRFSIDENGCVRLSGKRYSLCGKVIDRLLPWALTQLGMPINAHDTNAFLYPLAQPASRLSEVQRQTLFDSFGQDNVSLDPLVRLRHGHGHSQEDIWHANYCGFARIPDAVIYPRTETEVSTLLQLARTQELAVIPYGGGTNVTNACRCPVDELRPILSVDTSRMNTVRWIDPRNHTACIEAGATGAQINAALAQHGFTLGHEPDSYELSTLGGWIATHASGMKKNRYGNIEDIVLDCRVVTPAGQLLRTNIADRESIGFDHRKVVLGSEGRLGIVTQALVRIHPLPTVQAHESLVFPDFQHGVAFFHALQQSGQLPASIRLMDNRQFMLGQYLKPSPKGFAKLKSALQKFYLRKIRGLDLERIAACTVLFEGSANEVKVQRRHIKTLMQQHGGLFGGAGNGRQGYTLTFGIAYLRDFLLTQWVIAESFETTVAWSGVTQLCERVRERVEAEHNALALPGRPFLSYRLTQAYHSSACLYFYLGFHYKGVDAPSAVYCQIEHAAREAILASGGTLSHHHGIGKIRQQFLRKIMSAESLALSRSIKNALDPHNILVSGNQ